MRSDAVLRIATRLGAPLPLLAALLMPLPKALLRDPVYDQVRRLLLLLLHPFERATFRMRPPGVCWRPCTCVRTACCCSCNHATNVR